MPTISISCKWFFWICIDFRKLFKWNTKYCLRWMFYFEYGLILNTKYFSRSFINRNFIFVLERPSYWMHLLYRLVNVINIVCSLRLSLLKQGLSKPEFYGDLVYKFRKWFGRRLFWSVKNTIRYKRTGYNIHVMRQSACLCDRVHAWWLTQSRLTTSLFNCTLAGRASDVTKGPA